MKARRGFTLIELLVVIAIIGILSTIVLASLSTARLKARDARRVADVKQIQLALAVYYDANSSYPLTLAPLAPTYISVVPTDPLSTSGKIINYTYVPLTSTGGVCTGGSSYHLGSVLEDSTNSAFNSDADAPPGNACTQSSDFDGVSAACTATHGTPDLCYDVTP